MYEVDGPIEEKKIEHRKSNSRREESKKMNQDFDAVRGNDVLFDWDGRNDE